MLEVVNVAVVTEAIPLTFEGLEKPLDGGCPAGTGDSGDEDVIAEMIHGQPNSERSKGSFLSYDLAAWFDLSAGAYLERLRITTPAEFIEWQGFVGRSLFEMSAGGAFVFHKSLGVQR